MTKNYAWQGHASNTGNNACAKVQCCGTADYHTDQEICCVLTAPAPFLNDDTDTQTFIDSFYTRTRHSRETNSSYCIKNLLKCKVEKLDF